MKKSIVTTDRIERVARLNRNRLVCAVAACLMAYVVARLLVRDIAPAPDATDLIHIGQMIAVFCLPVMIVVAFGVWRRHAGLIGVGTCGCIAAGIWMLVA
ncbi:hypothetical protein [Komagataeibacter europaeus]|uniref:hypothetical protein n=1 Tax=Komagataeibacter europaeus TaxID=33995 RepID=UPI0002EB3770|nr:hypothetical protein [Komagataeibacter europaeus]